MPIYAFQCQACDHRFERLQKLSDADPTDCPECAEPQVRRQLTAPSFRLAGGGWYETDFKSDQEGKRNLAAGDEAPEAASTDKAADDKVKPAEAAPNADKKADKKPAAPAETSKPARTKSASGKTAARPAARSAKAHSKAKPKAAKRASKRRR